MTLEEIRQEVQNASLVLVGLGEELTGDMAAFYQELKGLLEHKDYFIVTLKDREGLEAAGLAPEQITAPLVDPEGHESWEKYLHWLSFTLNQKLCVLELGVGFAHPQLVRDLKKVAKDNQIPYGIEAYAAGATDASFMQTLNGGIIAGGVQIPMRYVHSYEVVDVRDVVDTVELLYRYILTQA